MLSSFWGDLPLLIAKKSFDKFVNLLNRLDFYKKRVFCFFLLFQFLLALPKLAIVLDDAGYSLQECKEILKIEYPLNIAVIPGQAYSRKCAELVRSSGQELLIHFPWENLGPKAAKKYPIRIEKKMTTSNVEMMLSKARESIPSANGVNNHMGSVISQDRHILRLFMASLSKYPGTYFLDSRTSKYSLAEKVAKESGLKTIKNNVFLDGVQKEQYIEKQFQQAIKEAKTRGYAVAIAHVNRKVTRRVLKNLMTKYNTQVEYVYLSDLVK